MLKPVKINITVPPSKSLTQRALLCNYLAGNKGKVINPLISDDTRYLQRALKKKLKGKIFLGNAGTAVRFLLPFARAGAVITGDKRMRKRPVQDLLDALKELDIETKSKNGCPPVKIVKREINKKEVTADASKSSQYLSSLLMLAPTLKHGLTIKVKNKITSLPYIDLTLAIMKEYGIKVQNINYKIFKIKHQQYRKKKFIIEGDASSASYWLTYNQITNSKIQITNLNLNSKQGDIKFIQALAQLKKGRSVFDFNQMPDCVMSMAIAAIFTNRKITIKNIANLKIKETNRLTALHYNLNKIGIKSKIGQDYIIIWGTDGRVRTSRDLSLRSFNDHRIVMAFGILGLKIDNKKCVNKSYPNFWRDYNKIKNANIILTGMRGVGKTTLGQKWAAEWGMKFVDSDWEIEKSAKKTVAQIVQEKGWQYFRDLEYKIVKKIVRAEHCSVRTLIATGGRTLIYQRNYKLLKNNYIILLTTDVQTIIKRIRNDKNRPSLTGVDFRKELENIWQQRKQKYFNIADKVIKT